MCVEYSVYGVDLTVCVLLYGVCVEYSTSKCIVSYIGVCMG